MEIYEQTIINQIVQSFKQAYDVCVKQKIPSDEKARILSLLLRTSKYEKVMKIFGCTQ
jgi:hypothetical protein